MSLADRIALAIDFSDASIVAARAAFRIASMFGAEQLTLVHSVREVVLPSGDQPKVRERCEGLKARIREAATKEMHAMCAKLSVPENLALDHQIVEGRPAEAIPRAAEDMGATLLMAGSHSRKGVRRWLKGSIAEAMLKRTTVPMLVLLTGDDGIPPDQELALLTHVLIAVDLDSGSADVVRTGLELAASLDARPKVVLLHVNRDLPIAGLKDADPEMAAYAADVRKAGEDMVSGLAERCDAHGLEIEVRIADGEPETTILAVTKELPAHLLVIGTHGRDGASRFEVGSTTVHIARHSDVMVLVVPSHPEQSPDAAK